MDCKMFSVRSLERTIFNTKEEGVYGLLSPEVL